MTIVTDQKFLENLFNEVNRYISSFLVQLKNFKILKLNIFDNLLELFNSTNFELINAKEISVFVVNFLKDFINSFGRTSKSVFTVYIMTILYLSASFHIVREWNQWPDRFKKIGNWFTSGNSKRFHFFVDSFSAGMKNWIVGQGILSFIMSIFYSICFSVIGILAPVPIGFAFGFAGFFPYVGDFVSTISMIISCIYSSSSFIAILLIIVSVFLGHILGGHLLGPILVGNHVGINPIQGILGFIIYSQVFGVQGIFLGLPISLFINSFLGSYFYREKKDFERMRIIPNDDY